MRLSSQFPQQGRLRQALCFKLLYSIKHGVIEDSRVVWELLRNQDEIKDLLMRDGYTEPAFDDLNEGINKLFGFSSKFIHRLDKDKKKTMPEIKASKEDAYLVYALSMNVVNLLSKKMQRLNPSNT